MLLRTTGSYPCYAPGSGGQIHVERRVDSLRPEARGEARVSLGARDGGVGLLETVELRASVGRLLEDLVPPATAAECLGDLTDRETSSTLLVVKTREMLRILRQLGAVERSGKGSHIRFTVGTCNTTVPNHKGEDLRTGTLNGIEADLEPCLGKDWLKKIIREGK